MGADGWTTAAWRLLCLLTCITAITPFTPLWYLLPDLVKGLATIPGLLVTLILAIATYADYSKRSESSSPNA